MKEILIVEDDAATAHAYRASLERAGYSVHTATDGEAGLDYVQGRSPDGVLLDLMMPNMNGIEFLNTVRACEHLARIPIMVFTNAFIPALVNEARAAGATEVFCKSQLTPHILTSAFNTAMLAEPQTDPSPSKEGIKP